MITDAERGWVAGVLDFQGHIVSNQNPQRARGSQQIRLYVTSSIRPVITRLCELTGGNPEWKPRKEPPREGWDRKGCAEHCPEAHVHSTIYLMPDVAKWTATGVAAAIVLGNVREHMTTDHEPWDWASAQSLSQVRLTGRGAPKIASVVRRYHERGWVIPPVLEGMLEAPALSEAQ